jgi:penicillin-insensitive murein endopeptidase
MRVDDPMRTLALLPLLALAACVRTPSALNPAIHGSIGTTSTGFLVGGVAIANEGDTRWLRDDGRHYGTERFVHALERAAQRVSKERPGTVLVTGDISARHGGRLPTSHLSHAAGRDADLLDYVVTLDGASLVSDGFVSFDTDGLGWDKRTARYVRFDVDREWLLIKALVEDEDARVQWIFISDVLRAIIVEWARARGDSPETILRAMEVMHQPRPGGVHDDHVHVRTDCSPEEVLEGCVHTGPWRSWHRDVPAVVAEDEKELVQALLAPMEN